MSVKRDVLGTSTEETILWPTNQQQSYIKVSYLKKYG